MRAKLALRARAKPALRDQVAEEKHFFYIAPSAPLHVDPFSQAKPVAFRSPCVLIFEKWDYKIKPPSYEDLKLPIPNRRLEIPTSALKNLG